MENLATRIKETNLEKLRNSTIAINSVLLNDLLDNIPDTDLAEVVAISQQLQNKLHKLTKNK